MSFLNNLSQLPDKLGIHRVTINEGDVLEIIILAVLLYYIIDWIKTTRAWALVKGFVVILIFVFLAYLFEMSTILWIAGKVLSFAFIAMIVVLQPELRRALEQIGRNNIFRNIFTFEMKSDIEERASEKLMDEIEEACAEMSKAKTGALITIEATEKLDEYITTGIEVDAACTYQLLINIFEKNTPLHDGAVIIRNNRVAAATCYLPVTHSSNLSKEFGTRHRAAVGMSEETDSITVIVSEETGRISVAYRGVLETFKDARSMRDFLKTQLIGNSEAEQKKSKTRSRRKGAKKE